MICKDNKHKWIHKTDKELNMNKKMCLWLVHECEKCGLKTHGFIKELGG